jgi:outer membrane protein assembly factor BamD (BamD/ComL family)
MMVLPPVEPEYETILERQHILDVLVTQLNTILLQDSLLTLSFMDSTELSVLLDSVIIRQERKDIEEAAQRQQRDAQFTGRNVFEGNNIASAQSGATWYFYNTSAVGAGQSEFIRRWGNRALEDNWRRSNKDAQVAVADNEELTEISQDSVGVQEQSVEDLRAAKKESLYSTIPFTDEARHLADSLIEVSYYTLGNIYDFELREKENAYQTFETLLERYPNTEYKPELLYQLYLIYSDLEHPRAQECRDQLLNDYPNSSYAKTLLNPNFKLEYNALAERMKEEYKTAYNLYRNHYYDSALSIIGQSLAQTPENSYTDNLKLLEILITGQTGNLYNYRFELEKFIKEYPESELNEYAQKLLRTAHELPLQLAQLGGATFKQNLNRDHTFVIVYPTSKFQDGNLARVIARIGVCRPSSRFLREAQVLKPSISGIISSKITRSGRSR